MKSVNLGFHVCVCPVLRPRRDPLASRTPLWDITVLWDIISVLPASGQRSIPTTASWSILRRSQRELRSLHVLSRGRCPLVAPTAPTAGTTRQTTPGTTCPLKANSHGDSDPPSPLLSSYVSRRGGKYPRWPGVRAQRGPRPGVRVGNLVLPRQKITAHRVRRKGAVPEIQRARRLALHPTNLLRRRQRWRLRTSL